MAPLARVRRTFLPIINAIFVGELCFFICLIFDKWIGYWITVGVAEWVRNIE